MTEKEWWISTVPPNDRRKMVTLGPFTKEGALSAKRKLRSKNWDVKFVGTHKPKAYDPKKGYHHR